MGRKAKPTHLKLIEGNPGRRPINKKEPRVGGGKPTAPAHLSTEAKREWTRISSQLHAIGCLTTLDRAALAVYCQAYGRWVVAERELEKMAAQAKQGAGLMVKTKAGNFIQNPMVGTANKAMDMLMKAAGELGMTPSVRTKIEVSDGGEKKKHPAAEFFGN